MEDRKKCHIPGCEEFSWLITSKKCKGVCSTHFEEYIHKNIDKEMEPIIKECGDDDKYYFISYVHEVDDNYNNCFNPDKATVEHGTSVTRNKHPFTWAREINSEYYYGCIGEETDCFHNPYQILNWKEISKEDYIMYERESQLSFWALGGL